MRVVGYDKKYKQEFIDMNLLWINEMFKVEDEDYKELNNIESYIKKGGNIFFAIDDFNNVMACALIAPNSNGVWEFMKFAAKSEYKGLGAGNAVMEASLKYVEEKKVDRVIIVSNTKCSAAVHLYRKYGFYEIPLNRNEIPFERCNILFERKFNY